MSTTFERMLGLHVSHVWFGDYSALYLELGELRSGKLRKDGTMGNPVGQITVYAGSNWRLEKAASIYCGKASTRHKRQKAVAEIQNSTVISTSVIGRIPELEMGFSNGLWMATFAESEGQPAWSVSFNSDGNEHLCVARGRLQVDRRDIPRQALGC